MSKTKLILVLNKSDISGITENSHKLLEEIEVLIKKHTSLKCENSSYDTNLETSISISCLTGSGISELENLITNNIKSIFETSSETLASDNDDNILITRDRHRRHLEETVQHLDMFLKQDLPMDLAAEELRSYTMYILHTFKI
jgi:tRNA modification GTPase